MAFRYSPKIVSDGLVYYIDNPNPNCYRPSGTTANNLADGDISTLENSLGFTNEFKGGWVFDGSNDYIGNVKQIDSQKITVDFWLKINTTTNKFQVFYRQGYDPVNFSLYGNPILLSGSTYRYRLGVFMRNSTCPTSNIVYSNAYLSGNLLYNVTVTYDWTTTEMSIYLNSGFEASVNWGGQCSTYEFDNTTNSCNFSHIGSNVGVGCATGGNSEANIYNFKIYDRILEQEEIDQNYNALKSRFGL
jgi:hypothetical protein